LWDYFQDMELNLIFPYIFQLYKRNWDTWNYFEVNHERLQPESLVNSYECSLCCLLIGKWNNQNFSLDPVQQTVYDAINQKILSLQINNFSQPAFNLTNQINNIKINGNLNAIEQEKNLASDNIQNEIIIKNNIDNNVHVNNQEKTNQIREVMNEKNENGNEGEIIIENKIQQETKQAVHDINKIVDIQNENGAKNSDTNENIKKEILTETEFKIQTEGKKEYQPDNNKTESRAKLEISDNNNIKRIKSEIEIHNDKYNLSENQSENENIVIKEKITTEDQTNENENKGDNSKFKFEHNNVNDNIVTDEIKEINLINTKLSTQKIQNENNERKQNKINASNSTLERNKKIAKALIIIGAILLISAIIVLLCKIYLATIILSLIGFVVAGIGIVFMIKVHFMKNNSELEKLSEQSDLDLGKTLSQPAKQMLENEQFVLRTQPPKVINQNEP
ncbi:MAG: hypothetical protein IJU86_03430, partial [Firmicutes bacterium]|nr:hypothetical protein [Bacillota bacterium]